MSVTGERPWHKFADDAREQGIPMPDYYGWLEWLTEETDDTVVDDINQRSRYAIYQVMCDILDEVQS